MKKYFFSTILFTTVVYYSYSQNVGINTSGAAGHTSAMLDVDASDKGILIPRISIGNAASAAPVTSPATGLMVYNTNASITGGAGTGFYFWTGSAWSKIVSGSIDDLYIRNQNAADQVANYRISGTGRANTSFQSPVYTRADDGTVGIRPNTNSATAIQLQNAAGTSILNVDATNSRVGIGVTGPAEQLHVSNNIQADGTVMWGNYLTRTETRDNVGLQGDAGAKSGFFETSNPGPATNWPAGATSWWHFLDVRHSNPVNNYAMQIAGSFFDQNLWFRKTNASATTPWSRLISSNDMAGTTNYVSKFTSANSLGNSQIFDDGTNVGIGTAGLVQKLTVEGRISVSGGVIQRGGTTINATSDLGLYSQVAGNWIRIATNAAPILFFVDQGGGNSGGTTPVVEINTTKSPRMNVDGAYAGWGIVPIGSIIAWNKNMTGTPGLPAGWVECNGQVLADAESPLNGQTIPSLNAGANSTFGGTTNAGRYLRGATTSGSYQADVLPSVYLEKSNTDQGAQSGYLIDGSSANYTGWLRAQYNNDSERARYTDREVRPLSYTVVWVMRTK